MSSRLDFSDIVVRRESHGDSSMNDVNFMPEFFTQYVKKFTRRAVMAARKLLSGVNHYRPVRQVVVRLVGRPVCLCSKV